MVNVFSRGVGAAVVFSALVLSGCDSDSDDPVVIVPAESSSSLRVIHASSDAPAVNLNVNGAAFSAVQGLAYGEATSVLSVPAATYNVSVDAVLPGDAVVQVVAPVDLTLAENETVNVVAIGRAGGAGEEALAPEVVVTPDADVAATETRVQVVHASVAAEQALPGGVSVYVTAPGADISAAPPLTTFNLRDATGAVTVPAGNYQIRITPAGTPGTVVFDSGTIALPGGADLMVLAVDTTGPGAPVQLLVSTGDADSDFVISDKDAGADLRVVHAAAGVGAAEVFAASASASLATTEVIDSILFAATEELNDLVPANDYVLNVNQDGAGAAGAPISASDVTLATASYYTVLAAGDLGTPDLFPILAQDDRRSIATEARVRAIHAASTAGTVDVFVTPAGDVTVASIELGEVTPAIPGFDVADVTDYLSLAEGDYDVRVGVPDGSGGYSVAIDETYTLNNGDVITLVAHNPDASVPAFGFIVLAD